LVRANLMSAKGQVDWPEVRKAVGYQCPPHRQPRRGCIQAMVKELSAGLKVRMIEIVISAGVGDEFNRRSRTSPVHDLSLAVLGGRPVV
jgi:hypothetical protein